MRSARYIVVWLGVVIAVLASAAGFNVLVDPYDVFGTARLEGFNAYKPSASEHTALVKAFQIERTAPRTVLLGTSRIDIGLDPEHPDWPRTAQPIYNYGLPIASVTTMRQQLQHAVSAGPIRTAIVGMEFHDFLRPHDATISVPAEAEQRIDALARSKSDSGRAKRLLLDSFNASLTLTAFIDSVATVIQQRRANVGDLAKNGLTSERPYAELVRTDGQSVLFTQKDLGLARSRARAEQRLSDTPPTVFGKLDHVRALIEFCQERNIQLTLVIPPYHAHYLEILDATELWERFESWKRALVEVVEEYKRASDSAGLALWDFASYDQYTTEAVPQKEDRGTSMRWFWEPVHYKKALGDIMLSRMLASSKQDFGVELTSNSVEGRLDSARKEREAYREKRPGEIERINAIVRNAQQRQRSKSKKRQFRQPTVGGG